MAFTQSNPGSLSSALRSGLTCGESIHLLDGTYSTGDLTLNLYDSCPETEPIVIRAENTGKAIINGGYYQKLNWVKSTSDTLMYTANLPASCSYSNLMVVDGVRQFPYATIGNNLFLGNYNLTNLKFGRDGFCRDATTIAYKSNTGVNPNQSEIVLSQHFRGLSINGNGHALVLRLKGIIFQNYGKSKVEPFGSAYNAQCLNISNCKDVAIDSCAFRFNDGHVLINNGSSNVTIQNCTFKDNNGLWSHAMIKKSFANQQIIYPTSRGRSLENAGIYYTAGAMGSNNLVVRGCTIDGIGDGVGFNVGSYTMLNVDFYNNKVLNCFDGTEFDGSFSGLKIFCNTYTHNVASISLAPPTTGPTYIYRNVIADMVSRDNTEDDTYMVRCSPPTTFVSQGLAFKTNTGATQPNGADLHIINNTVHSSDSNAFVQYIWDDEWKTLTYRNNIFYNEFNTLFFNNGVYQGSQLDTTFHFDSDNDWYFAEGNPVLTVKAVHGQYDCSYKYWDGDSISVGEFWASKMNSAHISITNDWQSAHQPRFVNIQQLDFRPLWTEYPDRGRAIPGFYDFKGDAPDMGALEVDVNLSVRDPRIQEVRSLSVYPNPAAQFLHIHYNGEVVDVDVYNLSGQRVQTCKYSDKIDVSHLSAGVYVVKVNKMYAVKFIKTSTD